MMVYTLWGTGLIWAALFAVNFLVDTAEVCRWVKGLHSKSVCADVFDTAV